MIFRQKPGLARCAVVDLGSNSVRLVVFEGTTRNPTPIFNEKAVLRLGRGLNASGKLNEEGLEQALMVMDRYGAIARAMAAEPFEVLCTAAVRDASNGPAFVEALRARLPGVPILTLSSDTMPEQNIVDYALNFLRVQLFTIPGIAIPGPYGGKQREVTVDVLPKELAAKGLSAWDIVTALQSSNVIVPAGTAVLAAFFRPAQELNHGNYASRVRAHRNGGRRRRRRRTGPNPHGACQEPGKDRYGQDRQLQSTGRRARHGDLRYGHHRL